MTAKSYSKVKSCFFPTLFCFIVLRVIFIPVKNDRKSTGKLQNVCFDLVWMSVLETECANNHDNKSVFIELHDIRMARSILRHSWHFIYFFCLTVVTSIHCYALFWRYVGRWKETLFHFFIFVVSSFFICCD